MFLQRLYELRPRIADRLPPAYFKKQPIKWAIELSQAGEFLDLARLGDSKKGLEMPTPYKGRSGRTPPPFLLVDKHSYLLGTELSDKISKANENKKEALLQSAKNKNEQFVNLIEELVESLEKAPESLTAVKCFYEREEYTRVSDALEQRIENGEKLKDGDLFAFRVNGEFPHELKEVRDFWANYVEQREDESSKIESECILLGERRKIAATHPIEFPLGPERTKLITANESAYLSYGLKQSGIAPVSLSAARHYGEALRYLLTHKEHYLRVGEVYYIFWTREDSNFEFGTFLLQPEPEQVKELLKAVHTGQERQDLDKNYFYAAALSSSKARLVVRDYVESTVETVKKRLALWFARQRLAHHFSGETGEPLGVKRLASSLVRKDKKTGQYKYEDLPPQIVPQLVSNALLGIPLPSYILQRALQRTRAEKENPLTYNRAVLIKMVLNDLLPKNQDQKPEEEQVKEQLDPNETRPAYLCGRLFAALENAQRAALGKSVKATIADRFFGTASSAPASVFGRLLRGSQAHLQKLRKSREGAYYAIQQQIEEIMAPLQGFPRTLTLIDQGLFAIGYYHQKAAERARIEAHKKESSENKKESSAQEGKPEESSEDDETSPSPTQASLF